MILLDPDARPTIGHRGASGSFPENTLLALREALRAGADAVEFDVRVSADGVPVIIHDATLERTTDGSGRVADFALRDLRGLDAGRGEKIPLLEEALEEFSATPIILEIKDPAASIAVEDALLRHRASQHVLLGSFHRKALARFDRDRFLVGATRQQVALFFAGSRLNLAVTGHYRAFCVPETSGALTLVDRRFVRTARKSGKPVHVWTVDDETRARRLRGIGVSGLISNHPARMVKLEDEL